MDTAGEPSRDAAAVPPRPDGTRSPGWFPDESRPERFRHWDGGGWNAMTSTSPVWGPEGEPKDRSAAARLRTIRGAVAVAAAMVLLAGAGFFVVGGGDDELAADGVAAGAAGDTEVLADTLDRDDVAATDAAAGTGGAEGSGDDVSSSARGSGGAGDGSSGSGGSGAAGSGGSETESGPGTPGDSSGGSDGSGGDGGGSGGSDGGSGPGGAGAGGGPGGGGADGGGAGPGGAPVGSPSPDLGDGGGAADVASCDALGVELQAILRAFPGLQAVSRTMTIEDVRCNARWASGTATSVVTPRSLAVFERQGGAWVLVAYGTDEPCRELALSAELATQLRCS